MIVCSFVSTRLLVLSAALALATSGCGQKHYMDAMEADDVDWVKEH